MYSTMKKFLIALVTVLALLPTRAYADVTAILSPSDGSTVTDLSVITITFEGTEVITKPTLKTVSAQLVNETTKQTYEVVSVGFSWANPNAATLKFGIEGTTTPTTITTDGKYKLTIAAGSFKSEDVDPIYISPELTASYIIGAEKTNMTNYTLTPAPGDVESISSVTIDFPDTGLMGLNMNADVSGVKLVGNTGSVNNTVYKVYAKQAIAGSSNYTLTFNYENSTVDQPLTILEPGEYTLTIPANTFSEFFSNPVVGNNEIVARFTIKKNGGPVSRPNVSPAAGEVTSLSAITFSFGGNEVNNLQKESAWENITLTDRSDNTVYKCESVTVNASTSSAVATFATIKKSGEYLLTVPAGAFSGYTSAGRLSNDGFNILYTIPAPTGTDDLLNVTFESEETIVESIQHITFTFPDAAEGLKYPFASSVTSDITLAYTPSANLNADEEVYHPIGAQLSNGNTVTITFSEALTATGTYKLTIPAGVFEEENNPSSTNALIERTYSIDIRNGVDSIIAGNNSTFTVISLQGVTLLSDASAEEVADLPAGIYIINGHKVIIK